MEQIIIRLFSAANLEYFVFRMWHKF